jgi:hypothetical protein
MLPGEIIGKKALEISQEIIKSTRHITNSVRVTIIVDKHITTEYVQYQ